MPSAVRAGIRQIANATDYTNNAGPGTNGYALKWDNAAGKYTLGAFEAAGAVAAHVGLANPHTQYLLASGVSAYGATLIDDADASTARTTLGLGTMATATETAYLLADGSRAGATSGLQAFTGGIVTGIVRPASDSTTAIRVQNAAGTSDALTVDTTNGRLGIGTSPTTALDIVAPNTQQFRMSSSTTDATIKNAYWQVRPYTNAQVDTLAMLFQTVSDNLSYVSVGGGSSVLNAATSIFFYTAATGITRTGTVRMRIDQLGRVGIGITPSGSPIFQVGGDTVFNGKNTIGSTTGATAFADLAASTTSIASLRVRLGVAPTTPNDGDVFYPASGRLTFRRGATSEAFATGVQATGGSATASASYTAAEQSMLQKVYDAARAFGLLS